jgi:GTPase SAR1 family protein
LIDFREQSFENVKREWYPLVLSKTVDACIVIVGNKADLNGRILREEPEKWCN